MTNEIGDAVAGGKYAGNGLVLLDDAQIGPVDFAQAKANVPDGARLPTPEEVPALANLMPDFAPGKYWTSKQHDEVYAIVYDVHDFHAEEHDDGLGRTPMVALHSVRYVREA